MIAIGTFLDIGILWLLIVLFTDAIDAEGSYRETWIVIIGVKAVGLASSLLLAVSMRQLVIPFQLVALYFLLDWSCGTDRRTTLKICGWYLVASVTLKGALYWLTRPR
jgi:hypothetical protein